MRIKLEGWSFNQPVVRRLLEENVNKASCLSIMYALAVY